MFRLLFNTFMLFLYNISQHMCKNLLDNLHYQRATFSTFISIYQKNIDANLASPFHIVTPYTLGHTLYRPRPGNTDAHKHYKRKTNNHIHTSRKSPSRTPAKGVVIFSRIPQNKHNRPSRRRRSLLQLKYIENILFDNIIYYLTHRRLFAFSNANPKTPSTIMYISRYILCSVHTCAAGFICTYGLLRHLKRNIYGD